jgi:4-diphosphocytidyl-2-C-methyl-D-erythritol kinase
MQINEFARAKINLCLHVTGQRDDGYHLLDSIVVFADVGDHISITPSVGFSLTIDGPFACDLSVDQDNLILRAAKLYVDVCDGAAIKLTKNLPVASGIGGGSADAAATLRALSRMTDVPLPDDRGLSLGADVPVCLLGTACQMQGIGDVITPIVAFPRLSAVLVCPKAGVATSLVFAAITQKNNPQISKLPVDGLDSGNIMGFINQQRNDMEIPSANMVPEINQCLEAIRKQGALLARMSGSGATCVGLFSCIKDAQIASDHLQATHPDWWIKTCNLSS